MDRPPIKTSVLRDDTLAVNPGRMLDNDNAQEMVDIFTSAHEKGYLFVIVDMADLEFLSSAGVGSILGTIETLREKGGDVILCNLSPTIEHVLKVLDLGDYLTIHPDREQAEIACHQ